MIATGTVSGRVPKLVSWLILHDFYFKPTNEQLRLISMTDVQGGVEAFPELFARWTRSRRQTDESD